MNAETEKQPGMDRRRFLVATSGATLALMLYGGMTGASSAQASQEFIETTCGKDQEVTKRVLIAYASKCGSTGSVAEAMGEQLCAMGASVDVRLIKNVTDLAKYQAVIVGSAIRAGRWLSAARDFVENNQDALSRVPVAYFVVCFTMKDDTPENRQKVLEYLDPVREDAPKVKPVAVGLFPGVVDYSKLGFMHRTILSAKGVTEGDYRNLPAVKTWASDMGPKFIAVQSRGQGLLLSNSV